MGKPCSSHRISSVDLTETKSGWLNRKRQQQQSMRSSGHLKSLHCAFRSASLKNPRSMRITAIPLKNIDREEPIEVIQSGSEDVIGADYGIGRFEKSVKARTASSTDGGARASQL